MHAGQRAPDTLFPLALAGVGVVVFSLVVSVAFVLGRASAMPRKNRKLSRREVRRVLERVEQQCLACKDGSYSEVEDALRVRAGRVLRVFGDSPKLRVMLDDAAWDDLTREFIIDLRNLGLTVALELDQQRIEDGC